MFILALCQAYASGRTAAMTYDALRKRAADLSRQPYIAPAADLPQALQDLDYDGYQAIDYRHDKAIWTGQDIPFRVEFFHRGYLYPDRVEIYLVENRQSIPVEFHPDLFRYHRGKPIGVAEGLGFAGFRIVHQHGQFAERVSFLGASYFRAAPRGGVYGISARGVAIHTAVADTPEEFPAFRSFWIARPEPGDEDITVYALLDGPSVTGAYQFEIRPGKETVIHVRKCLFLRNPVTGLGLAPLTSMYLYGEDGDAGPAQTDHRPEVHDSDGLLLATGSQWLWRPLRNPRQSTFSSFGTDGMLKGFGLLQRDRQPRHYDDPRTSLERRPSCWVEPVGPWPAGRVELLELPSRGEGMDNIVAQYVMDPAPQAGQAVALEYRLRFYSYEKPLHTLARVLRTVRAAAPDGGLRYTIDFAGDDLPPSRSSELKPVVTAAGGDAADIRLAEVNAGIYRVTFRAVPQDGSTVVELRASLIRGDKTVSEIWSDQWNP